MDLVLKVVTILEQRYPYLPKMKIMIFYICKNIRLLPFQLYHIRDVPDPDSTIRYPVKCTHPALSGIRVKFAGYYYDILYYKHQIQNFTVV